MAGKRQRPDSNSEGIFRMTPRTAGSCYDYANDYWLNINEDFPDITAAFYDRDFSKTLTQAQTAKHEWILKGIDFEPGRRILDIGCGWGPMLAAIRAKGGKGIGFTISEKQVQYCTEKGLEVYFEDWKDADAKRYGEFDAIVSIGAFEHFCSPEEYIKGRQEKIYEQFFRYCHQMLKKDGKVFLQTMTWGYAVPNAVLEAGRIVPLGSPNQYHDIIIDNILGLSSWWPPSNEDQILKAASPYFEYIGSNSGREDYAQTFFEWHQRWRRIPTLKRWFIDTGTYLKYFAEPGFIGIMKNFVKTRSNELFREAFLQKVLDHSRIFFIKLN